GSVIAAGIFKNPFLVLSLAVGIILEVTVISIGTLSHIFGTVPLNTAQWIIVAVLSIMPLIIVEAQKAFTARFFKKD
ncbi:MAG: cation transporting ATPase C-terminal domain-containing protein, partial [Clostridia bacterium]|nr:cation transporting ATPase C-terminal domain-containing protein [Clostridia bacterium]